jgi:hypothetical protein
MAIELRLVLQPRAARLTCCSNPFMALTKALPHFLSVFGIIRSGRTIPPAHPLGRLVAQGWVTTENLDTGIAALLLNQRFI